MMRSFKATARRFALGMMAFVLSIGALVGFASAANAATVEVEMTNLLKFAPASVTAKPGDTIVWKNNAGLPHNVVFEDASKLDADAAKSLGKLLGKGEASLTLPADLPAGTYKYYCTPHRGAGMAGEIVVQ